MALPGGAHACGVTDLVFNRTVGETTGTLAWQAPDGPRPRSYEVYRDARKVGETAGRSLAVEVRPGRRYVFSVRVIDANGLSLPCLTHLKRGVRFHPPFRTPGLAVLDGGKRVRLAWSRAVPGDGRVVAYRILRDGRRYRRARGLSLRMRVPAGRPHAFVVEAVDSRGNAGPRSNTVKVLKGHRGPGRPGKPRTRRAGDAAIVISWSAARRGSGRIAGYRIYRSGKLVKQVRGRRGRDWNLAPATTYRYSLATIDTLGYMSAPSPRVSITTAKPDPSRGRAHAFLLASAGDSFRDLQRHYTQIGTVYPTYFDCDSTDGSLISVIGRDDPLITSWSQLRGIRVMPRFNCQDPGPLHGVLTDPATRDSTIAALVELVRQHDYDGINIDFENGAASDRDALTAYVGRLAAANGCPSTSRRSSSTPPRAGPAFTTTRRSGGWPTTCS